MNSIASGPTLTLQIFPAGISLDGGRHIIDLPGRPMEMLSALTRLPGRRGDVPTLCQEMPIDVTAVSFPEQCVRDAAWKLRSALKLAAELAGSDAEGEQLLRSVGRGKYLTYVLQVEIPSQKNPSILS